MKKAFTLLPVLLLALTFVGGLNALQSQHHKPAIERQEAATPIQEGIMSARQKEHSKLYCGYKGAGKNLGQLAEEQIRKGKGDDLGIVLLPGIPELSPTGTAVKDVLAELSCGVDAIVIGTVKDKTSQLTDCGTFTFTDYELIAEEVLKDNVISHLEPGSSLIVTRPGGKILLNGHVITAIDRSVKPLIIGDRYLLFLRFLPTTGAYEAADFDSAFRIAGSELVPQTDVVTLPNELKNRDALVFTQGVRNAATFCKAQGR